VQSILIPDTDLTVSRLSFGTASLHHLFSEGRRQDLLQHAIANGFTHFDTAPYYGFGLAEVALGRLPARDRDGITVATKVGLYGPDGARPGFVNVLARKITGKVIPRLNRAVVDWRLERARQSLVASLRRLRRERVDVLYLHEPEAALIETDEWLRWLESSRRSGQVGRFGIAGEARRVAAMLASFADWPVVQMRDSLVNREADLLRGHQREMQFTYGYLADWRQRGQSPSETLAGALRRNCTGSILVSTRHAGRVAALATIASSEQMQAQCTDSALSSNR
jgi:aryl-alcohol dehydrogenase-like predicted oxidoreductase